MSAPLISRASDAETIRKEIRAVEREIARARAKRDGVSRGIAERQVRLDRLKTRLAEMLSPAEHVAAMG